VKRQLTETLGGISTAESDKKKDFWDKLASVTPLVLGIAITGVGAFFSQIYNYRQLQLNQIAALDKLRPLLTSEKAEEREFAYTSFAALGYEDIAVRMIQLKKDQSGRSLLVELKKSGPEQVKANAGDALKTLDEAQKLVNIAEFGAAVPSKSLLNKHPELAKPFTVGQKWSQTTAQNLGITSKLGVAILYDTVYQHGTGTASKFEKAASNVVASPLNTREKEIAWLNQFLDERETSLQRGIFAHNYSLMNNMKKRIDRLRNLIKSGDWDLKTMDVNP
jgi:hypothetical protein